MLNKAQKAAVFDEWARRYAEDPDQFTDVLDDQGKPISDYGSLCAAYFDKVATDLGFMEAVA